jgi:hypothetical protein
MGYYRTLKTAKKIRQNYETILGSAENLIGFSPNSKHLY